MNLDKKIHFRKKKSMAESCKLADELQTLPKFQECYEIFCSLFFVLIKHYGSKSMQLQEFISMLTILQWTQHTQYVSAKRERTQHSKTLFLIIVSLFCDFYG